MGGSAGCYPAARCTRTQPQLRPPYPPGARVLHTGRGAGFATARAGARVSESSQASPFARSARADPTPDTSTPFAPNAVERPDAPRPSGTAERSIVLRL